MIVAQEGDETMEHDEPPDTRLAPVGVKRGLPRLDLSEPLTPSLVPVLVLGLTVLAGLAGIGAVVVAFEAGLWPGLLALAVVPFAFLGVVALGRVLGELALAVIRMHQDLAGIAERFPHLEATMDEVAGEIPRLGFLKLLSGGRERSG
ncbi:MAG TPA: DUF4282 domain-containing protein [Pseudonocardia sp.]|nr:DUF4282 domain-containing protein [Pseudonocardia sp.]